MSDLESYQTERDERAFRALVDAHLGMVFGTAMRRLGDRELAEEVAQNVFGSLARKARGIRSATALPAWLHRATVMECSKAIRTEVRRRKRMEKLIEITALEGDGKAAWGHAKADLDEAVDELPAADREVLFQRFYEGKSFRQIANATGKTEAASQKQASRALGKLADRMRARGFAVPATVLAAALGAELGTAAPAGLAAGVSAGALAGAATSGTINILGIMTMTKSTLAGAAVAAALVAASTGGGFLSGRSFAKAERAEARTAGAGRGEAAGAGSASVGSLPVAARGSVREILQTAADHFANAGSDPAADAKGEHEIARLRPDEVGTALAELAMFDIDPGVLERIRAELVEHWARSNGEAAAAYALSNAADDRFHRQITAALTGWGGHDPEAAYAWFRQHLAGGGAGAATEKAALQAVLRSWASTDPHAALAEIATLPYDQQRHLDRVLDNLAENEETRSPYLEALRELPDGQLRLALLGAAVDDWSKVDPPAAAEFWDSLEFAEPMQALEHAFELGENWFERDPAAAADWMWGKLPDGVRGEFVDDVVKRHWAGSDPEAASAWLEKMGLE